MKARYQIWIPAACAIVAAQSPVYHRYTWPVIRPFSFTQEIKVTDKAADIHFPIPDTNGKVVYTLRCVAGTEEALGRLGEAEGEDYEGPLLLLLYEGKAIKGFTILGYDGSATWHTRAQVRTQELLGRRGAYPEFGRLRHFRLRGFELTVRFSKIARDADGNISSLRMSVSGRPDASVTSSREEPCGFLPPSDPPRGIQRGIEPRMFRDHGQSWCEERKLTGPVELPGANPAVSPNKRYSLLWVEPSAVTPRYMVLLHDHKLKNSVLVTTFRTRMTVLWSPGSSGFAAVEEGRDGKDTVHLYSLANHRLQESAITLPQHILGILDKYKRVVFELGEWVSAGTLELAVSASNEDEKDGHAYETFRLTCPPADAGAAGIHTR